MEEFVRPDALKAGLLEASNELFDRVEEAIGRRLDETNRQLHEQNRHLRELNGRVGRSEVLLAKHDVNVKNLNARVFKRRETDKRVISERDVRIFVAGATALVAVVGFFWKVFPVLLKAVQP